MTASGFTHRPSYPHQPETFETDRLVFYDGKCCGVAEILTAHRGTVWEWSAFGPPDQREYGEAATREEALELVKAAVGGDEDGEP